MTIAALREESARIRVDAYLAADQMAEDAGHTSAASDARAHLYMVADKDHADRNAAIDRLAGVTLPHPNGNPYSHHAELWLLKMGVELEAKPVVAARTAVTFSGVVQHHLSEEGRRHRFYDPPRASKPPTAAEYIRLKREGTMTEAELALDGVDRDFYGNPIIDALEVTSPKEPVRQSLPGDMERPVAPPGLEADIAAALARCKP
jgi:hypothetical protein